MVSNISNGTKREPSYCLQQCKDAICVNGKYRFSKTAENFITDLNASSEYLTFDKYDVKAFILSLERTNFIKSVLYKKTGNWMDVYKAEYNLRVTEDYDKSSRIIFYFKFCMLKEHTYLHIISFHEDR